MMRTMIFLLATLTASWAHADVSDSGNLSIGGNGVIAGTMTVQGSAFSVGGTTFSVAGGSATFGGIINAAAAGIRWADGSTSTTAASGSGSGAAMVLSSTTVTGSTTNTATTAPCISTVSVTLARSDRVVVWFAGNADNWPSAYGGCLGFRVDGGYNDPNTSSAPTTICTSNYSANIAGPSMNASFSRPTTVLAAGTHNFCLFLYAYGGGTASIGAPAQFGVYELNTGGL